MNPPAVYSAPLPNSTQKIAVREFHAGNLAEGRAEAARFAGLVMSKIISDVLLPSSVRLLKV